MFNYSNSLPANIDSILPALSGDHLHYNPQSGMAETDGYTSAAGNTYYQGIKLSDRLIIACELGQGYMYLFLNGIRVYCFNGSSKRLIGTKSYHNYCYSKRNAADGAISIVSDYIKSQMMMTGNAYSDNEVKDLAQRLVAATDLQL